MTVAEQLNQIIKNKGITYSFVSKNTGIPIDAISRSMHGKRRLPADEMVSICELLGLDLSDLKKTKEKAG